MNSVLPVSKVLVARSGNSRAVERALEFIPSHWRVQRFKGVTRPREERNTDARETMLSLTISGRLIDRSETGGRQEPADESVPRYFVARPGDLVVNPMWLTGGSIGVSDKRGAVSPDYRVFEFRDGVDPQFLHAVLRSTPYFDQYRLYIRANTTFDRRIKQDDLDNLPIPVPPLDEQRRIADFLHRETAQIDALIAKQQNLVSLLTERRRAFVTTAVACGLRDNEELVESSDSMLGRFPARWRVRPLRYCMTSLDGWRIPLSSEERGSRQGDYPYYGASGVIDHVDSFLFDEPLVLVSEDGANLLARSAPVAFVATGRYWVNNHAHVLRPVAGPVEYWAARIEAIDLSPVVTGAAQPKLTADALMRLPIAAPDFDEQVRIVEHIKEGTAKIDALIAKAEELISLARERRAALITEAVTGKIDVSRGKAREGT